MWRAEETPVRFGGVGLAIAVATLCLSAAAPGQATTPTAPARTTTHSKKGAARPKDPVTPAQRREIERLLAAEREALAKERAAVAAERQALDDEKAALEVARRTDTEKDARIEALTKELAEQRARIDALDQTLPTLAQPPKDLVERLAHLEEASKKNPELPPDAVSAGDFRGSIRIPGTSAAFKVGGVVWTTGVSTLDALGSDDRFLTYSIPVQGDPDAEKGPRTTLWAGPSRLNFDVRTRVSDSDAIRAFIEGDFAGASNGFRLRHAYMQYRGFVLGRRSPTPTPTMRTSTSKG